MATVYKQRMQWVKSELRSRSAGQRLNSTEKIRLKKQLMEEAKTRFPS